jgi:NADH-quinone oxidoreductase subunit M
MAYLLTLVTFVPLVGAILVLLLPRRQEHVTKLATLATTLVTFAISLPVYFRFDAASADYQFVEQRAWIPSLGVTYHVGVDGISVLLVLLTTFLMPLVLLSSWTSVESRWKEFAITMLLLETGMLGVFVALDLFLFYVFWEAMLIPMYLLIGIWGSERRIYAAVKFFLFTFVGSVLMLLAIFYLWAHSGAPGQRTFDYVEILARSSFAPDVQMWLFLAFALAFAIKVPVFPLHTWLPDAHTEAPAAGSVLLAGVMLKLGTFGFIRYAMPLFPQAAQAAAPAIAWLGVIGIVYGSFMCMAQTDLKRLIAYSSVAHLGFVMTGLAALTPEAVSGAVLQMVNHGISTGGLFLLIGMLYERTHTRDLAAYGGIAKSTPALAAVFLVVTLSSIGLPGTNGFIGEFLILIGTFTAEIASAQALATVGATGVILGAVYMLWMYQRVFLGPLTVSTNRTLRDLSPREWATLAPLLAAIVIIGVYPGPFLAAVKAPVDGFIKRVTGVAARAEAPRLSPSSGASAPRLASVSPR